MDNLIDQNIFGKTVKTPKLSDKTPKTATPITPKEEVTPITPPKPFDINTFINTFTLKGDTSKLGFNYGTKEFTIDHGNDFFKALRIIRNADKKSKQDATYLKSVMDATGLDEASARQLGDVVHQNIKDKIKSGDYDENGVVRIDQNIFGKTVKTPKLSDKTPKTATPVTPIKEEVTPVIKEEPDVIIPIDETVQPLKIEELPTKSTVEPIVKSTVEPTAKAKATPKATVTPPNPDFNAAQEKAPPTEIAKDLKNILDSLTLGDGVEVSRTYGLRHKVGTIAGQVEKGIKKLSDYTPNLRNIWQTARSSAPLFANRILEHYNIDKRAQKFPRDFQITPDMVA